MMADMGGVEVVVAHNERATLRVGDVFVKIDSDQTRTDVEVQAMAIAPIPNHSPSSGPRRSATRTSALPAPTSRYTHVTGTGPSYSCSA